MDDEDIKTSFQAHRNKIVFYKDDTWNVNVAKMDGLIKEIHEKSGNESEDAERVMEQVFKSYMELWEEERDLRDVEVPY